jgi:uncharacterized protein
MPSKRSRLDKLKQVMTDSWLEYCLRSRLRSLFTVFLLAAAGAGAVDLSSLPKPTGFVSDLAHVLSPADQADLEVFCIKVQQQLGAQFAIVTIPSLDGAPIEEFSIDLARKWGIGPKAKNEGLLILLVIKDRKERIEVGRGLEPYITDAIAGDTRRSMIDPLKQGNYGGALVLGVRALAAKIAEGKQIPFSETTLRAPAEPQDDSRGVPVSLIVFVVIFLAILFFNRRGGGGGIGSNAGFWAGLVASSMLNRGRGGGSWGGGGGFGGGSGGGGGFGGFGGGDFGGGGSSGDW